MRLLYGVGGAFIAILAAQAVGSTLFLAELTFSVVSATQAIYVEKLLRRRR